MRRNQNYSFCVITIYLVGKVQAATLLLWQLLAIGSWLPVGGSHAFIKGFVRNTHRLSTIQLGNLRKAARQLPGREYTRTEVAFIFE